MAKNTDLTQCPLPTKCIYDDYLRTGVHYCSKGKCIHKRLLRTQIARQIHQLVSTKNISATQSVRLKELKEKYAKTLKSEGEREDTNAFKYQ